MLGLGQPLQLQMVDEHPAEVRAPRLQRQDPEADLFAGLQHHRRAGDEVVLLGTMSLAIARVCVVSVDHLSGSRFLAWSGVESFAA